MSSRSATAVPEVEDDTSDQLQPLYHVILLNDEDHTYDYVVEMLQKIFTMTESKAFSHAVEVDTKGTTILLTCELEKAELKRDLIVVSRTILTTTENLVASQRKLLSRSKNYVKLKLKLNWCGGRRSA